MLMPSSQRPPETHTGGRFFIAMRETHKWRTMGCLSEGVLERTYCWIQACVRWFGRGFKVLSRWRIRQSFMFPGDCLALLCLDNIRAFVRCSVMITDWFCFSPYPLWSQSGLVGCWCETVQVWQANTTAWLWVSGQLLATPRPPWEHKVTS